MGRLCNLVARFGQILGRFWASGGQFWVRFCAFFGRIGAKNDPKTKKKDPRRATIAKKQCHAARKRPKNCAPAAGNSTKIKDTRPEHGQKTTTRPRNVPNFCALWIIFVDVFGAPEVNFWSLCVMCFAVLIKKRAPRRATIREKTATRGQKTAKKLRPRG